MIRLSKLTDYGVVLLAEIAANAPGATHSATELAEQTRLPLPTVSKVLKTLTRSGLLDSARGATGGYRLSRPAAEISLADAIRALDGPIALTECCSRPEHTEGRAGAGGVAVAEDVSSCGYQDSCLVRVNWQRLSHAIESALDGIPITEMINPSTDAVASAQTIRGHGLSGRPGSTL